jgi:hypothetical protein
MWVLILYIGVSQMIGQVPFGGPATAEFASQSACEAALSSLKNSLGEERPFDQRFQLGGAQSGAFAGTQTRLWTVKGTCVPKGQ